MLCGWSSRRLLAGAMPRVLGHQWMAQGFCDNEGSLRALAARSINLWTSREFNEKKHCTLSSLCVELLLVLVSAAVEDELAHVEKSD